MLDIVVLAAVFPLACRSLLAMCGEVKTSYRKIKHAGFSALLCGKVKIVCRKVKSPILDSPQLGCSVLAFAARPITFRRRTKLPGNRIRNAVGATSERSEYSYAIFVLHTITNYNWLPLDGAACARTLVVLYMASQNQFSFQSRQIPGFQSLVSIDLHSGSKEAADKRRRNAAASARFRSRRKKHMEEAGETIVRLRKELEEAQNERERFRQERDYYRVQLTTVVVNGGTVVPQTAAPFSRKTNHNVVISGGIYQDSENQHNCPLGTIRNDPVSLSRVASQFDNAKDLKFSSPLAYFREERSTFNNASRLPRVANLLHRCKYRI